MSRPLSDTERIRIADYLSTVQSRNRPMSTALVLCVDEKSQIQALDRTQPGLRRIEPAHLHRKKPKAAPSPRRGSRIGRAVHKPSLRVKTARAELSRNPGNKTGKVVHKPSLVAATARGAMPKRVRESVLPAIACEVGHRKMAAAPTCTREAGVGTPFDDQLFNQMLDAPWYATAPTSPGTSPVGQPFSLRTICMGSPLHD